MTHKRCDFCAATLSITEPSPVLVVPKVLPTVHADAAGNPFATLFASQGPRFDQYDMCADCARGLLAGVTWLRLQMRT